MGYGAALVAAGNGPNELIFVTPERWQQVKDTLVAVLERPDEKDPTTYLREKCADDTELYLEVESLLNQPADDGFDCARKPSV